MNSGAMRRPERIGLLVEVFVEFVGSNGFRAYRRMFYKSAKWRDADDTQTHLCLLRQRALI